MLEPPQTRALDAVLPGDRRWTVVLTATEVEAGPLLERIQAAERLAVATKTVYLGEIGASAVVVAVTGCGITNTAHLLTCLLQSVCAAPALVVQTGTAGAFRPRQGAPAGGEPTQWPGVGDVVLATQEAYSDLGSATSAGWLSAADLGLPIACVGGRETAGVFTLDQGLVERARRAILAYAWPEGRPTVAAGPCVTSSRVTGTDEEAAILAERWHAVAESMEGAAAAHVCTLYDSPFLEVRGISNWVGERDRAAWQIDKAARAAAEATVVVVTALGGES